MAHGQDNVLLDPLDPRWFIFAGSYAHANIFHHPAWMNLLAKCYGHRPFVIASLDDQGEIRAGVPVMEINNALMGRRWVSLPYTDHCSPLYTDDESYHCLGQTIYSLYGSANIHNVAVRWDGNFLPSAQRISEHVLHTLDLEADPGRMRERLHATHRRNIKIAQNSGLRVERGVSPKHLRQFYRLHLETRHRQGMPIQPWRFFELLGKRLLEPGLGFILLAYHGDECIASSIFLHSQKTLMYKYGASNSSAFQYRPNNLLMWTAIQWGCENGYTRFDMGRTNNENTGLRRFKAGFGAQEMPLTYSVLADHPIQNGTRGLTKIMHLIIRHSPLWFCQAVGETLYRYFG